MGILPFDPQAASPQELAELHAFFSRLRVESWPDDPPKPLTETVGRLLTPSSVVRRHDWLALAEGRSIVGAARATYTLTGNLHALDFEIKVLPELRRQGLGRSLLQEVARLAREQRRSLLTAASNSVVPAGAAFLQRLGARVGMESYENRLELAELDRDLLTEWQEKARGRAAGYQLGGFEGRCPDEEIEALVAVTEVMNTAPRDTLELEDMHFTAGHLREYEASLAARNLQRWVMYVRPGGTREMAGYTEVFWRAAEPELVNQGDTAVAPAHRNRGLGRWLKAAMLEKVLRERPQVRRIRTWNARSNEPMLKLNFELGFRPYKTSSTWQVSLDDVERYLAAG